MFFNFGDKVRDTITGYEGTVVARYEYMNGCVRYQVDAAKPDRSGIEELIFDVQRLEMVKAARQAPALADTGGARSAPPRTGAR